MVRLQLLLYRSARGVRAFAQSFFSVQVSALSEIYHEDLIARGSAWDVNTEDQRLGRIQL